MRELEMGNDDLERNERAVSSSLADIESKYAKALEEKILIEHELLDKANVEEECQRLKDEIRGVMTSCFFVHLRDFSRGKFFLDANLEVSLLKDQLGQARAYAKSQTRSTTIDSSSTSSFRPQVPLSDENILAESPPTELQMSDLMSKAPSASARQLSRTSSESSTQFGTSEMVSSSSMDSMAGRSSLLKRVGLPPTWAESPTHSDRTATAMMSRSHTVSTFSPSRLPTGTPRPLLPRAPTEASASTVLSTPNNASKNRGVQMVSEMRARVRNLEQRLHTRVPRLRMGSVSGRKAEATAAGSVANMRSAASTEFRTPENRRTNLKRRSVDLESERKLGPVSPAKPGDTSGWVLIMEESMTPSPTKDREKERRRLSSPTSSSPFSLTSANVGRTSSMKASSTPLTDANFGKSGIRRPQSRLSGDGRDSTSTVSTTSTLPTPTSRPTTPTFLPMPSSGMFSSGLPMMKRQAVPGQKRSSLGTNSPSPAPTSSLHPPGTYRDNHLSSVTTSTNKSLPPPPANVTVRSSRPPSALGQSRIGRPASGRRSAGADDHQGLVVNDKEPGRLRSGSTTAAGGRGF